MVESKRGSRLRHHRRRVRRQRLLGDDPNSDQAGQTTWCPTTFNQGWNHLHQKLVWRHQEPYNVWSPRSFEASAAYFCPSRSVLIGSFFTLANDPNRGTPSFEFHPSFQGFFLFFDCVQFWIFQVVFNEFWLNQDNKRSHRIEISISLRIKVVWVCVRIQNLRWNGCLCNGFLKALNFSREWAPQETYLGHQSAIVVV